MTAALHKLSPQQVRERIGAGLTFAGLSGLCGMARLLMLAPWNRAKPV
jgi:hypothetical protein